MLKKSADLMAFYKKHDKKSEKVEIFSRFSFMMTFRVLTLVIRVILSHKINKQNKRSFAGATF